MAVDWTKYNLDDVSPPQTTSIGDIWEFDFESVTPPRPDSYGSPAIETEPCKKLRTEDGSVYIYTRAERAEVIRRYKSKIPTKCRTLYKVRKDIADSRLRIGGRFAPLNETLKTQWKSLTKVHSNEKATKIIIQKNFEYFEQWKNRNKK